MNVNAAKQAGSCLTPVSLKILPQQSNSRHKIRRRDIQIWAILRSLFIEGGNLVDKFPPCLSENDNIIDPDQQVVMQQWVRHHVHLVMVMDRGFGSGLQHTGRVCTPSSKTIENNIVILDVVLAVKILCDFRSRYFNKPMRRERSLSSYLAWPLPEGL